MSAVRPHRGAPDRRRPSTSPRGVARLRFGLLGAALACLGLAAWNPAVTLDRPVVDAVVVLDVSQSMDVPDMRLGGHAASRLAFARAAVRDALDALPCGSRLGLGIFSEYRILLLTAPAETCAAHADLNGLLARLDNRLAWTNASEVRKGVLNAREAVLALPGQPALVFMTDGQEAPPLAPGQGRRFDGKPGEARGVLVGVGGDVPQPIPKTDKLGQSLGFWQEGEVAQPRDRKGSEHLSALDEPHLAALATEIGFGYHRLDRPGELAALLAAPGLRRAAPAPLPLGDGFALAALLLIVATLFAGIRPAKHS